MPAISPTAVLGGLNNGSRTIWDLAALFQVPAAAPELRQALDELLTSGLVVASEPNIYQAVLTVVPAQSPT
jgi:hypothetical protein